jgi:hypothetical protein
MDITPSMGVPTSRKRLAANAEGRFPSDQYNAGAAQLLARTVTIVADHA